jgi:ATP-dependent Clp protease protease subunit
MDEPELDIEKESLLSDFLDHELLKRREIFLFGDIDEISAKKVIQQLLYLENQNSDPIIINIHSEGGEVDSMYGIVDIINLLKKKNIEIVTVAMGKCYSAAACILTFGSKGKRCAMENCTLMFHPISYEIPFDYVSKQQPFSEFNAKQSEILTRVIAKNVQKKEKDWAKLIEDGLWLSAKDALKLKIIDEII